MKIYEYHLLYVVKFYIFVFPGEIYDAGLLFEDVIKAQTWIH